MAERQRGDRGGLRILLALALVLPIAACSESDRSGSDEWANPIKSSAVGEDYSSAAPGCDAPMEQLTEACNDEINRHHSGHH